MNVIEYILGRISLLRGPGPDLGARPLFCMCIYLSVCLSVSLSLSFNLSFLISLAAFLSFFHFFSFLLGFFFFPSFLQGRIQRREAPLGARPGAAAPRAPMVIRLRLFFIIESSSLDLNESSDGAVLMLTGKRFHLCMTR